MTRSAAQGNESNEATGFSKTKLMIGENEANNNFDFSRRKMCSVLDYTLLLPPQSSFDENRCPPVVVAQHTSFQHCPTAVARLWCVGKKKTIEIPAFQFIWGPESPISLGARLSSHCFSVTAVTQWLKPPSALRRYFNQILRQLPIIYSSTIFFEMLHFKAFAKLTCRNSFICRGEICLS